MRRFYECRLGAAEVTVHIGWMLLGSDDRKNA